MFHLTDLIEAGLVEPRESVLHGGKPVGRANRVRVVQLLVQLVRCHHVVVAGGGGGEAVRGADGVGGALGGEARHRPQAGHHGVRLLERPQRVSDLRKLFSPAKKQSVIIHILVMLHFFWILHYWEACSETVDFLEKFGGGEGGSKAV